MAWTARHIWSTGSRFVFNFYRHHSKIIVHRDSAKRSFFLDSKEGISQGCPLSMMLCGLLLISLLLNLNYCFQLFSPWFADDGSGSDKLKTLHEFFDTVRLLGKAHGCFPEMEKSVLIIATKNANKAELLNTQYQYDFKISHGHCFLGRFIGTPELTDLWVEDKVSDWTEAIEKLLPIAHLTPQCAFAGFQRCLQHKWLFLQRALPSIQDKFEKIEHSITKLLSSIFHSDIDQVTRSWTSIPIKSGGAAIPKPIDAANLNHITSTYQCAHLIQALLSKTELDLIFH